MLNFFLSSSYIFYDYGFHYLHINSSYNVSFSFPINSKALISFKDKFKNSFITLENESEIQTFSLINYTDYGNYIIKQNFSLQCLSCQDIKVQFWIIPLDICSENIYYAYQGVNTKISFKFDKIGKQFCLIFPFYQFGNQQTTIRKSNTELIFLDYQLKDHIVYSNRQILFYFPIFFLKMFLYIKLNLKL
jgi:hypothetical protein